MDNYIAYLGYIENKIGKFFEEQKPYIFCKKGCSKCCEKGDFPFKQIEFAFLIYGFSLLPDEKKQIILDKVRKIKKEKSEYKGENFVYECPFLIDHACSVYDYRGVICRGFGLMSIRENGKNKIPFCAYENLNYSNVIDAETNTISEEKFLNLGIDVEPLAYNVGYKHLTSEMYEEAFQFKFGELRALIDWFEQV